MDVLPADRFEYSVQGAESHARYLGLKIKRCSHDLSLSSSRAGLLLPSILVSVD